MITEDEVMRLLERADPARDHAAAATVDAAGYLDTLRTRTSKVTVIDTQPTPSESKTGHRWLIAAAAVAVAIVVGALLVAARDDLDKPEIPAAPPAATGDLIISVWSHPIAGGDNVHVRVYADGRVVRNRQANWAWTDLPGDEGRYLDVTGWLEYRLTPEGLQLLRSEISSSGLFDPDQPIPDGGDDPFSIGAGIIEVLNGDRSIEVHCCWGRNIEWLTEFKRLLERLREPESWLPPSAWENLESTPYAPSWYAICLSSVDMTPQPIEPSPLVTVLPAPAQDRLDGARHWSEAQLYGATQKSYIAHCFDLDADNARRFTGALDGAEFEHDEFHYRFEANPAVGTLNIFVSPYLPHGEADCGCSG